VLKSAELEIPEKGSAAVDALSACKMKEGAFGNGISTACARAVEVHAKEATVSTTERPKKVRIRICKKSLSVMSR
jgi:hypothetical protein